MSNTVPFYTVSISPTDPQATPHTEAGSLPSASSPDPELRNGDILIEASEMPRPSALHLRDASLLPGWDVVANSPLTFGTEMRDAGWIFFLMARRIRTTTIGFDRAKVLRDAVTKLAGRAKAHDCNAIEIMQVTHRRLLGVSRVSISAHFRHLQRRGVFL